MSGDIDFGDDGDAAGGSEILQIGELGESVGGLFVVIVFVDSGENLGGEHPVLVVGEVELDVPHFSGLAVADKIFEGGYGVKSAGDIDADTSERDVRLVADLIGRGFGVEGLAKRLESPRETGWGACLDFDFWAEFNAVLFIGEIGVAGDDEGPSGFGGCDFPVGGECFDYGVKLWVAVLDLERGGEV